MLYPAKFEKEESGLYAVSFRDIPEAITCGDDYDDAVKMAKDALLTCMDFYFEDHRRVPLRRARCLSNCRQAFLPRFYCSMR